MRLQLDLELRVKDRRLLSAVLDSTASTWVLTGPSGSGKSTLLRALAGVSEAVCGLIEIDGARWDSPGQSSRLPPWERRVGWMPQDAPLFPHLSVVENLRFGERDGARVVRMPEVVEALRLGDLLARRPRNLSGGEKQRVALGRALLGSPRLLLLDEPFAFLDRPLRAHVIKTVGEMCRRWSLPALIVSHDVHELAAWADVELEVSGGAISAVRTSPPG